MATGFKIQVTGTVAELGGDEMARCELFTVMHVLSTGCSPTTGRVHFSPLPDTTPVALQDHVDHGQGVASCRSVSRRQSSCGLTLMLLRKLVQDKLILPYLDLSTEMYDLGLPNRDETDDWVCSLLSLHLAQHTSWMLCGSQPLYKHQSITHA
jgi:hypothetical protein